MTKKTLNEQRKQKARDLSVKTPGSFRDVSGGGPINLKSKELIIRWTLLISGAMGARLRSQIVTLERGNISNAVPSGFGSEIKKRKNRLQ